MTTTTAISNTDQVIDSRDVIARIEELTAEFTVDLEDADDVKRMSDFDFEEVRELSKLMVLQEEAQGYAPDWKYGATLIHEDYFVEYAKQLAEDTGAINPNNQWPYNCIDWDSAAEELKVDYTAVDFDGATYYVR